MLSVSIWRMCYRVYFSTIKDLSAPTLPPAKKQTNQPMFVAWMAAQLSHRYLIFWSKCLLLAFESFVRRRDIF